MPATQNASPEPIEELVATEHPAPTFQELNHLTGALLDARAITRFEALRDQLARDLDADPVNFNGEAARVISIHFDGPRALISWYRSDYAAVLAAMRSAEAGDGSGTAFHNVGISTLIHLRCVDGHLAVRRSSVVAMHPNLWMPGIAEGLLPEDFGDGPVNFTQIVDRAAHEELGVPGGTVLVRRAAIHEDRTAGTYQPHLFIHADVPTMTVEELACSARTAADTWENSTYAPLSELTGVPWMPGSFHPDGHELQA